NHDVETNIFPNPTHESVTIQTNRTIKSIEVFDCLGKRVKYISSPNSNIVQLEELNKGVYFIKIKSTFSTSVHPVVKE
ncbi:MAG TPA: T9SS type A sorting domain-containing protein, partial [Phaeodactylibacter sp.]|nr:T9SS type A sorting domain-containing protein [Phaeodactylibacter sp.]